MDRFLFLLSDQATCQAATEEISKSKWYLDNTSTVAHADLYPVWLKKIKGILGKADPRSTNGLFILLRQLLSNCDPALTNYPPLLDFLIPFMSSYLMSSKGNEGPKSSILHFLQIIVSVSEEAAVKLPSPLLPLISKLFVEQNESPSVLLEPLCQFLDSLTKCSGVCALFTGDLGDQMKSIQSDCLKILERIYKGGTSSNISVDQSDRIVLCFLRILQNLTVPKSPTSTELLSDILKIGLLPLLKERLPQTRNKQEFLAIVKLLINVVADTNSLAILKADFLPKVIEFATSTHPKNDIYTALNFIHCLLSRLDSKEALDLLHTTLDWTIPLLFEHSARIDTIVFTILHDYTYLTFSKDAELVVLLLKGLGVGVEEKRGHLETPTNVGAVKEALQALINISYQDQNAQIICYETGSSLFQQLFVLYESHKPKEVAVLSLALARNLCIDQLACKHVLDYGLDSLTKLIASGKKEGRLESFQIVRNLILQNKPGFHRLYSSPRLDLLPEIGMNLTLSPMPALQKASLDILEALVTRDDLKDKTFKQQVIRSGITVSLLALSIKFGNVDQDLGSRAIELHSKIKAIDTESGEPIDPFQSLTLSWHKSNIANGRPGFFVQVREIKIKIQGQSSLNDNDRKI